MTHTGAEGRSLWSRKKNMSVHWSSWSMIQNCLLGTYCMQGTVVHVGETLGLQRTSP